MQGERVGQLKSVEGGPIQLSNLVAKADAGPAESDHVAEAMAITKFKS